MNDPLARIGDTTWDRVERTVAFFMQNGPRLLAFLNQANSVLRPSFAIRGILLQDVFGNGQGLINTLVRSTVDNSFLMSILGINPPKKAAFTLTLTGVRDAGQQDPIFTVDVTLVDIDGNTISNDDLTAIMSAGTIGGSFPMDPSEILVELGNPISNANLIGNPGTSYTGRWTITFTPEIMNTYDKLLFTITNAAITGNTGIIINSFNDIVTTNEEIVTDVYNRSEDNPWSAGSIVLCTPMIDVGYAIAGSDYRDVIYVPPPVPDVH